MDQNKHKNSFYRFYDDDRSLTQKAITNRLARLLTDSNLTRIQSKQGNFVKNTNLNNTKLKKQDFLYVCIQGIPPFQDQFLNLSLPGQLIRHKFSFNNKDLNLGIDHDYSFKEEAFILHSKIESASKIKPIVFIYHSFGTFVLATYFQHFSHERMIGMIDIGGSPIRPYNRMKNLYPYLENFTVEDLKRQIDVIYADYKTPGRPGSKLPEISTKNYNKKELLGILILYKMNQPFKEMFWLLRDLPKVLKCFILGRKDTIIVQQLANQKFTHYSYKVQFDKAYEERLKATWENIYGSTCQNIQQKFIFNIDKGAHSIHVQKKFVPLVQQIISQYLSFIQSSQTLNFAKI